MEWAMMKKDLAEVIVRAIMSLYRSAKTQVRVGADLSDELLANNRFIR